MTNFEFQITIELIKRLLEGLKVEFLSDDLRITLHPPQKGVFFTQEELARLQRTFEWSSKRVYDQILEEKFGKPI
jgi:hypothetical protein